MIHLTPKSDKRVVRTALVCLIGLGGFLLWGAFAPLEEGIAASGKVVVDSQRKVVQHLEGGIISEIRVRDGQWVEQGQVVLVLEDTVSLASRDLTIQEYAALAASVERLQSLKQTDAEPDFSLLDKLALGEQERSDIIEREWDLFHQQKSAQAADLAVLEARRNAAVQTQKARSEQITIVERALKAAREEYQLINTMLEQRLARRDQATNIERQVINLESEIAQLHSEKQNAAASERDLEAQIRQTGANFRQQISATLLETRTELQAVEERLSSTQNVLDRSVIRAPVSGEVLNMQFATVGGVLRPGETIMEIIPNIGEVTASIRIAPQQRASVFEGQTVRTQISAYKGWQAPQLQGKVLDVSADLKTDPTTSQSYYEARVLIPADEMQRANNIDVTPGMPVDAFIFSGRSRTMFDYLFEPLGKSIFQGLRSS
ncbi:HlyD family type I secretion periplasmic adaptor subunit [Porticoccus sp. W117]|uniref:HlyD family type I secretion periplasmic adaptor subunit n=1 Tax=Porticoccus sp. W117 TaxID=3054777 RepID=UPI00259226BE|nr:HlyD family type I secretion periplasmic adaptor subunit [Porticoccus sp. W117]MDM3871339.1 HlyD family type I secretion periplasmic adaptor subunit [Porticoccus sp. W117]